MSPPTYVDAMADAIRRRIPQDLLPDDAGELESLFRLYALLAFAKGDAVTTCDVHDAWAVWMADRGKDHESVVPFDELAPEVQREDEPFVAAIREAVWSCG